MIFYQNETAPKQASAYHGAEGLTDAYNGMEHVGEVLIMLPLAGRINNPSKDFMIFYQNETVPKQASAYHRTEGLAASYNGMAHVGDVLIVLPHTGRIKNPSKDLSHCLGFLMKSDMFLRLHRFFGGNSPIMLLFHIVSCLGG